MAEKLVPIPTPHTVPAMIMNPSSSSAPGKNTLLAKATREKNPAPTVPKVSPIPRTPRTTFFQRDMAASCLR